MGKKNAKTEEKKVRAADFANFQTSDSRPTGLHQIFASFNNTVRTETNSSSKSESSTSVRGNRSQDEGYSDTSESQANILALLNKLTKKDSLTKLKALEMFNELVETTPESVLEEYIVDIIHLFKKSAVVEPVKKIRLEFGNLLCKVSSKLRRKLQHYLESFITHWWVAMHDESSDIAEVYVEAFRNLFATSLSDEEFELKTLKILNFYFTQIASDYQKFVNKDLDSYGKDWLDTFGKSSQSSASIADMHNRLFYSILHSLMKLFVYARVHREKVTFDLDQLVQDHFVSRVTSISKMSFKKRLSCVLMLVEMVKVLPKESHGLLEKLIGHAVETLKMETEPALIYHNVRLVCACTRENSGSLTKFLPNYHQVVVSLLKNFNGEYGNKVDLYTLFPSLYMYIDPEYFQKYKESFEDLLNFLAELMTKEVLSLRRNAYAFDLVSFRTLGTRMLCCFYKLLLLSKKKSPELITLPLEKLAPVEENSRDFLWNYPAVMTEYVAESNLLAETTFVEMMDRLLSYAGESTVLVASILDNLLAKYAVDVNRVYPGLEVVYEDLMKNVTMKLPDCLEQHLKHKADLTLDIEQLVQLLKKNSLTLPHHIPMLLFKSQPQSDFLDDYKLLLQVYKNLNTSVLEEWKEAEELDARLLLFYAAVEMDHNEKVVELVLGRQFDLEDICTYFLVNEFLNGCKGSGHSNELIGFAQRHISLELFHNLLGQVEYSKLTSENRRVYQTILITYQLYENKYVEFEGEYDRTLAESILTSYLYLFLRNRHCDYMRFTKYVLEEFANTPNAFVEGATDGSVNAHSGTANRVNGTHTNSTSDIRNSTDTANGDSLMDEVRLATLDSLPTNAYTEFESTSKDLGSLLGTLFEPDFVVEVLNRTIGLTKSVKLKTLHKRCYYLVVNVYIKSVTTKGNANNLNVDRFMDIFVKVLVGSGLEYCPRAHADFITITTKYRLDDTEVSRRFLENMVSQFMEEKYKTVKKLDESVKIFQYFYKAVRMSLPKTAELVSFVKTWFDHNLAASHFLAAIYEVEDASEDIIRLEIQIFKLLTSNIQKKSEMSELEGCECYTFLNSMTLSTQLIENYKAARSIENLECEKLVKLFTKEAKGGENQIPSPHNGQREDESDQRAEEDNFSKPNLEELRRTLSNTLKLFFRIKFDSKLENSWAYLSIYRFISLFPLELTTEIKDDRNTLNFRSLKHLYSSISVHGVSTNLFTAVIKYTLENGLVLNFRLGTEVELERAFEHQSDVDKELTQKLDNLVIRNQEEATTVAYWLPLCLKYGLGCLDLEDGESVSEFSEAVCSLLQHIHQLQPASHYVNRYVARLWECRSFYPKISESGVFCNFPNREHVCMISSFPNNDFFQDLNTCKIDAYRLLYTFNNYSNKDEDQNEDDTEDRKENESKEGDSGLDSPGDLEEGKAGESEEEGSGGLDGSIGNSVNMGDVRNGYDLMKLYFSLIIGPYLTRRIMTTYENLETSSLQEIERCLMSWLTVFNMHAKYKAQGNLNCANALVKLLTEKPYELGEYINEAFQENLGEALQETREYEDMSHIYSPEFGLGELYAEEYFERDYCRNSLLDIFLRLLIQCLEKMLIKDEEFCETVKMLYYKAAKIFPTQVSEMWNNCKNSYVKKNIKKFTKHEVTQKLIKHELESLKNMTSDLTVYHDVTKKEVTAKLFVKNEINAKITIKVPSAFPLEPLTFMSNENKKNHKWIMYSHSEANRSGIAQGLLLWYNNVVKYYQGIEECPICYSIVHTQFQSIPSKSCKVCKYKFHKECLFKWFRNAAKAKCPLCQSQVSFL
ncbi:RING-type E3 ubiquitin transferase [Theileria orientalis]|uniref:E3 ubiquitin-protein ligase listerin n=1 Tax=Theileria orientalis TaxID=68886 RepID=A0A976MDT6_THEOR|nr:RING-type E3 ubiquitin transferase [Theileria orientalis]